MPKFEVEVEGTSPLMMHRYIGKDVGKKVGKLMAKEQASMYAYRVDPEDDTSNLAANGFWFRGALIESFCQNAGNKMVSKTKTEVQPAIQIMEALIDLGTKTFSINEQIIPIKTAGKISDMTVCIRPELKNWKCSFTLVSLLNRPDKEIHDELMRAGRNCGVGSARPMGNGRFKVTSFKKI